MVVISFKDDAPDYESAECPVGSHASERPVGSNASGKSVSSSPTDQKQFAPRASARVSMVALTSMPDRKYRASCVAFLDGDDCLDEGQDEGHSDAKRRGSVVQDVAEAYAQRKSMLNPEAIAILEQTSPGMLGWLKTAPGFVLELTVFCVFVGINTCKNLILGKCLKNSDWEEQGVVLVTASLVLAQSLGVVLFAMTLGASIEGIRAWRKILDIRGVHYRKFGPMAVLFALAQIFQTLAYTVMTPGTITILGQGRLLTTALLSRLLLGRRYIQVQWYVMVMIILGSVLHLLAKQQASSGEGNQEMAVGLFYLAVFFASSDIAVVAADGASKVGDVPFWLQEFVISAVVAPVSLAISVVVPMLQSVAGVDEAIWGPQMWWKEGGSSVAQNCLERTEGILTCGQEAGGFWRDWNQGIVWVCVILGAFQIMGAGLLVRILSGTTKRLAKVIVFGLVYFLGDCILLRTPQDGPISVGASLAAVQVMGLTYAFFMLKGGKTKESEKVRSAERDSQSEMPVLLGTGSNGRKQSDDEKNGNPTSVQKQASV